MIASLRTWNWMRSLRAFVAIAFVAQGIHSNDGMAYAIGAFFGLQALLNVGCCGSGECATKEPRNSAQNKETTYTEIK
jgi:hypothetical protein